MTIKIRILDMQSWTGMPINIANQGSIDKVLPWLVVVCCGVVLAAAALHFLVTIFLSIIDVCRNLYYQKQSPQN